MIIFCSETKQNLDQMAIEIEIELSDTGSHSKEGKRDNSSTQSHQYTHFPPTLSPTHVGIN